MFFTINDENLDLVDLLCNHYMRPDEIKHLGILCRRAKIKNQAVSDYLTKMYEQYIIFK